ncbi:MAG TPA: class I tRNA ligase family protein, partial [Patescibacteria group bacterium]|nr:class I tRNA ligase family protein [Patescibacteria group bacterium]
KPLAKPAIEAVRKGNIKFHPKRWTKVYLNWMENIQDWCISRQIWWGHRIPVYYCDRCEGAKPVVAKARPQKCPSCGSQEMRQDEDVLDTWFSSWLWPFATFYWPKESAKADLKYFYPTSTLVTAPEIIFFWVARMIMAGFEFMGDIPFKDVYIHGTVRDIEGKKMSKSLGNVIDPLGIIDEYGADALRFSLVAITAQGQDVFLSKERFEQGRNFANKIWNASRFIMLNLEPSGVQADLCIFYKKEQLDIINRWILSRFYSVLQAVNKAIAGYQFNEAANVLYVFFWHEFCDWYLEMIKQDIKNPHNQLVMYKILEKFLRVLHPFMPFITEELWQRLPHEGASIMASNWPHVQEQIIDEKAEAQMESLFAAIRSIRTLRSEIELRPDQKIPVSLYPHSKAVRQLFQERSGLVVRLSGLSELHILDENKRPQEAISDITKDTDLYLHFGGLVDIAKEQVKIKEKIAKELQRKQAKEKTVANPDFLKKAEPEIIETMRQEITEAQGRIERMERLYDELR